MNASVSCCLLRALTVQRCSLLCSMTPALPIVCVRSASNIADSETAHERMVPEYTPRVGEVETVKRARLLYQSRKRGMLENGLVLSSFAEKHLSQLTSPQLDQYDTLINQPSNDWQLYYWFTGREQTPSNYDNEVMDLIKKHIQSGNLTDC